MLYMGSKAKLAFDLIPIIHHCLNKYGFEMYLEPFVGGANLIDKVVHPHRVGWDNNQYLIALFNYVQSGVSLPDVVSEEDYYAAKQARDTNSGDVPLWWIGCVGFLSSFSGRFFEGYSGNYKGRDYYGERRRGLLKQMSALEDVVFACRDYRYVEPNRDTLIYCDPPYVGTKRYSKEFDHVQFWEHVRVWSKKTLVLVSEQSAPDDFKVLWEKSVNRALNPNNTKPVIERLFIYGRNV